MNTKLIALMTPRDWQIQANKEATELVGSPDYYAKAAEAKRYGMLADALEAAQAEIADLLDQRRALMQATPSQAAAARDQALAQLAELTKQEPVAWAKNTERKLRITAMDMSGEDGWLPLIYAAAGASPQPSQGLQSVADALTIEQLNDKVARLMAAQPSQAPTCDLRGIDAGPLSEWVDLVRRGYVAKDECLIAVKDVPKWLAQNQPSQADAQDAARYRWLREYLPSDDLQYDGNLVLAKTGEDIDAAIDAAINAKGNAS